MADNTWLLIMACLVIVLGFYIKQFWLSVFFAAILIVLTVISRPAPARAHSGAKGPLVQPIVIRRKYAGPATLYPEKMEIYEDIKVPSDWREYGPEGAGEFFGKVAGKIKSWISDEE